MNLEKVIFGFFISFSCTLNFGFFVGAIDRPERHHPTEQFAAIVLNLIATVLKFGDRTQLGATHLATSAGALNARARSIRRATHSDRPFFRCG